MISSSPMSVAVKAYDCAVPSPGGRKSGFHGELGTGSASERTARLHDIFVGGGTDLRYPAPWAADASISHLAPVERVQDLLKAQGFSALRWEDKTEAAVAFLREPLKQVRRSGWPPLGLDLLMEDDASVKFGNVLWNLETGRVRAAQPVMVPT